MAKTECKFRTDNSSETKFPIIPGLTADFITILIRRPSSCSITSGAEIAEGKCILPGMGEHECPLALRRLGSINDAEMISRLRRLGVLQS